MEGRRSPLKPSERESTRLTRDCPMKQRGFYSDIITNPCVEEPLPQQKSVCQFDDMEYKAPSSQQLDFSYFCQGADTPKVQMPYKTATGKIPRKLEIERRRREYLSVDFDELLAEKGIDCNLLMQSHDEHVTTSDSRPPNLSLELFDNDDFDCRTPDDWLALGKAEDSPDRKPIPAKALLPTEDSKDSNLVYSWHLVGVLDYDKDKCLYLVEKVFQSSEPAEENPLAENKISSPPGVHPVVTGSKHWVPRIRLLFRAEDPRLFVQRLQFAMRWRENTQALLLYHLSIDSMPIKEQTPSLNAHSLERIKRNVFSTPHLSQEIVEECAEELEKDLKQKYLHAMNRIMFEKILMSHPDDFSHITLPQREPEYVPHKGFAVPYFGYKKNRYAFLFSSLLTKPEVIYALSEIKPECNKVLTMRLFNTALFKPLRLDEFEVIQSQVHTQISLFLREAWVGSLSGSIRSNLGSTGKGTFNINESCWEMYRISKLHSLMTVVRYNMQDCLRCLVLDSLVSLGELMQEACHSVLTCTEDMVWKDDLITSPFKPKNNPPFLVDLVLDQTGVHYSTPLENFETSVVDLINKGIIATHHVPQLDKLVMHELFIGDNPELESVPLWEPEVTEMREKIRIALIKAIIPLKAYAAKYTKYLGVHNLDIETHIQSCTEVEKSPLEVQIEVQQNLDDVEILTCTLPCSILIGPFIVNVENVRQTLLNKRKALATAWLDYLAMNLRKQVDKVCEECNIISKKLNEKPNSIEELTEKRDWMKTIPDQMQDCKECITNTLAGYEITEDFFYSISDEDFKEKWTAIRWPQRILSLMETVTAQHVEDEERFYNIQVAELNSFEETLDSLKMQVSGFNSHEDINHASEIADKARNLNTQLKQCCAKADLYNNREKLFGVPITNFDNLKKLLHDFQPYKDLWITTSNWLRLHGNWLNDPLTNIDAEQLELMVKNSLVTIRKCVQHFNNVPESLNVASVIHGKIEDFRPHIPLIKGLKSLGMKISLWDKLSDRIKIKLKPKPNLNFSRCLELGLQDHIDDVAHVVEQDAKEQIEEALEIMELEWSDVLFDLLPYKDTYLMQTPSKVVKMLDEHIATTRRIAAPLGTIFEGNNINTWEHKLRKAQDVVREWEKCQAAWLYLKMNFTSEDLNRLVEGEHLYRQINDSWREIIQKALNNPKVIEMCQEDCLLPKMRQMNTWLENVRACLEC